MAKEIIQLTDSELVQKTLDDQENFRYIIERYQDKLLRYILRISAVSKEDAEDILQDIFISAYKNLNNFNKDLKFSSWIYRIAHNRVISVWRKMKNAPAVLKNEDSLELFNNIASQEDVMIEFDKEDMVKKVDKILKSMKKEYAEILVLKFLEDKSYIEISDILKRPMGTVATLISRAKKQFKEVIVRQGQSQ
jgi:RNA polymerase sigma-70 factor (ECF subfamily)